MAGLARQKALGLRAEKAEVDVLGVILTASEEQQVGRRLRYQRAFKQSLTDALDSYGTLLFSRFEHYTHAERGVGKGIAIWKGRS